MRSTFKILFYLKKNSPKPDGTAPLMCRITIDGTISQFSCKMDVSPHLWDTKAGRLTGKSAVAVKTNIALDKIRVDINRHYQDVMQTDGFVTADKVKNAYLGLGVKQDTLGRKQLILSIAPCINTWITISSRNTIGTIFF